MISIAKRLCFRCTGGEGSLADLLEIPAASETDALLKQSNELLKQLIVEVGRVLVEMETMNEMTRRRLPYKWVPPDSNVNDKNG